MSENRSANGGTWTTAAVVAAAWAVMAVAATEAAARCGDNVGDLDALAVIRAEVAAACDCAGATSHREYVSCARAVVDAALDAAALPRQCAASAMRCARRSTCGRPAGFVPCCRTNGRGVTRCSIKSSVARCRPPRNGSACASQIARSCCDACTDGGCILPTPTPTRTPKPTPTPPAFCESLVGLPPLGRVPVGLLPGTTDCGGEHFTTPPQAPFSGQVDDENGSKLTDLGLGCLYIGGLPPNRLSSGGQSILDVVGLNLPTLVLAGSDGNGPLDCTKGAGPGKHCLNGVAGTDGMGACETDADCNNKPGTCHPDANCFFGPPVPVQGEFATCAVNALQSDMCGSLNVSTFETHIKAVISARVYLTLDNASPCPRCVAGACTAGKRAGQACTPLGENETSPDCPPLDSQYLAAMQVVIPDLTTATSTLTADENGSFCDDQTSPGAFGLSEARSITQTGQGLSAGGLSGETVSVSTFCVYPSGNPVIDIIGGLPAAGTVSARSSVDLTGIIGLPPLP